MQTKRTSEGYTLQAVESYACRLAGPCLKAMVRPHVSLYLELLDKTLSL